MIQTMRATIQSVLFMLAFALFGPVAASAAQGEFVVATQAAPGATLTAGKWVRFAESVPGGGNNAGVFDIRWTGTNTGTNIGGHVRVSIGANNNDETQIGMVLNDASSQGVPAIGKVRLLEGAAGTTMYLEAHVGVALLSLEFVHEAGYGWTLKAPPGVGDSTGFTVHDLDTTGAFAVNEGSKSFMVTKDGNVGIGTMTPGQKLSVAGTIESTSGFKFPDGTTQTSAGGAAAGWTENASANTVYVTDTTRNIGIGTTTPGYKLDVSGDIRAANHVYVGSETLYAAGSKTAQKEENVGAKVAKTGWYRVAYIADSNGRGQNTVTVYTTGGAYDPRSTTIRWWHDYSTDAGLTILSETGSHYWDEARITGDTPDPAGYNTKAYLEIHFTQSMPQAFYLSMQYDGGYARGGLYSGDLLSGGGTVYATAPTGLLTVGTDKFFINTAGQVGIGTTTPDQLLTVNGKASKSGDLSWILYSDNRLKTISGTFDAGLNEVLKLQPIRYRYKKDNPLHLPDESEHIGFSAQEVQKIIPGAISENSQGYLMLNSDPILWAMLNAIKDQQKTIEKLMDKVSEMDTLKVQLKELQDILRPTVAKR